MNSQLLTWINTFGEPTTAELWAELTLAGMRKPPPGLPQTQGELSNAILALVVAGLLEAVEGDRWRVVRKPVKQEGRLFV